MISSVGVISFAFSISISLPVVERDSSAPPDLYAHPENDG